MLLRTFHWKFSGITFLFCRKIATGYSTYLLRGSMSCISYFHSSSSYRSRTNNLLCCSSGQSHHSRSCSSSCMPSTPTHKLCPFAHRSSFLFLQRHHQSGIYMLTRLAFLVCLVFLACLVFLVFLACLVYLVYLVFLKKKRNVMWNKLNCNRLPTFIW